MENHTLKNILFISNSDSAETLSVLTKGGYHIEHLLDAESLASVQYSPELILLRLADNAPITLQQITELQAHIPIVLLADQDAVSHHLQHQGSIAQTLVLDSADKNTLLSIIDTEIAKYQQSITQGIINEELLVSPVKKNEELLRQVTEFSHIGVMDWNVLEDTSVWSDQAAQILGLVPQQLNGIHYADLDRLIHPEDLESLQSAFIEALKSGGSFNIQLRAQRIDQTYAWVEVQGYVSERDGNVSTRLVGIVQDISQRKQAEREMELFRRVIESADFGVCLLNDEYRFLYCNNAVMEMNKFSRDELYGGKSTTFSKLTESQQAEFNRALSSGQVWKGLFALPQKNGGEFFANVSIGAISETIQLGSVRYFMIISDYSSELKNQMELSRARDAAEHANQAKSEFLSNMSHELRTPLNAILGFSQLMEIEQNLSEEQKDNISEIKHAGEHLLLLINEILDITKIESGSLELELEPLALIELVQECETLVSPLALERHIKLRHENIDVRLFVDRVRLKQVLLNLMSNAIKYNRAGGDVLVHARQQTNGYTRIEIKDTGAGIATDNLERIFKPFERLVLETDNIEGTGIGLMITRRLVNAMGGKIGVDSVIDQGSCFWVELPTSQFGESELFPSYSNISDNELSNGQKKKKVLYIEDDRTNLLLVKRVLSIRPYIEFIGAVTGAQGLELIKKEKPDIILLDIGLSDMDGYQLLEKIKPTTKTPIIAITAKAMAEDIGKGQAAGFDAYLTKPLDITNFFDTIDRFLI